MGGKERFRGMGTASGLGLRQPRGLYPGKADWEGRPGGRCRTCVLWTTDSPALGSNLTLPNIVDKLPHLP